MTRKDYELIAAALKKSRPTIGTTGYAEAQAMCEEQHAECVRTLARDLSLDNPRFDMARFFVAAGVA